MTGYAALRIGGRRFPDGPAAFTTLVELTWIEKRIENWIRFGHQSYEQKLDRRHRIVGFAPGTIFCLVRWAANDYGTIISRLDIVRAIDRGEPYQTLPFVRPGGEILLKVESWPKVEDVLRHVDGIEALDIDPADADPDHWRHVAHWMNAGEAPRPYTAERHKAWLRRREIEQ
ncbi:DUF2840 domain-containing protein [Pseudochelatococcus contaminans]|uniref:DUF2840 domain-containing protein n=1 Tax=Pseudochelatococcus contaminans TaxID=1538103 RepID=A0A7W6EIA1_9HYPH|nr:DUF2840 domain-containing protein [Pseudochelatococcus contaminans]MBB3810890.1 hypothetical protein [Pseudochelatococcus contaminans]